MKLLGYCSDDGERGIERLLVYEFMSNRSLEDHLFTRGSHTLPWKQRLEIILGAAEGLAYLHEVQVNSLKTETEETCFFFLKTDHLVVLDNLGQRQSKHIYCILMS